MSKARMRISARWLRLGTTSKQYSTGQSPQLPPGSLARPLSVHHSLPWSCLWLSKIAPQCLQSWVPVPLAKCCEKRNTVLDAHSISKNAHAVAPKYLAVLADRIGVENSTKWFALYTVSYSRREILAARYFILLSVVWCLPDQHSARRFPKRFHVSVIWLYFENSSLRHKRVYLRSVFGIKFGS